MHVFITGGSGRIGAAVVADLLANGHTVAALARSEASAAVLETAGATAVRGGLADVEVVHDAAAQCDGAIHLAFANAFTSPEALAQAISEESAALVALGDALRGTDRPFVTASGTPPIPGRASTEADPLFIDGPLAGRGRSTLAVLELASEGVRSTAVRLPRTVHSDGGGGFAGMLTDISRRTGVAG